MDERLNSTLEKIVLLCRQNPEFAKKLQSRLQTATPIGEQSMSDGRIDKIERYLGLDYSVDGKESVVDYSHIRLSEVKTQLICDNREMMRFRYGTRYHKTNFKEFCRYAHLQAEMLLNYYYNVIGYSDFEKTAAHIKRYNPKAMISDKANSIEAIPYNTKLWAFKNEYKVYWNLFDYIRDVRNEMSHRFKSEDAFDVAEYQKHLQCLGFRLKEDGTVHLNWKDRESDVELKNLFNEKIKLSKEFRQYQYLLWRASEPFDEVISGLQSLSGIIQRHTS